MHWSVNMFVLAGLLGAAPVSVSVKPAVFENYTEAYRAAKATHRPMLVILNPGHEVPTRHISLERVSRSGHRRQLLEKYVVVNIDASTQHGKTVHKLFDSKPLPRVVVIDKRQRKQIYRTSAQLNTEDWNLVLENYRNGVAPRPVVKPVSSCPFCK